MFKPHEGVLSISLGKAKSANIVRRGEIIKYTLLEDLWLVYAKLIREN